MGFDLTLWAVDAGQTRVNPTLWMLSKERNKSVSKKTEGVRSRAHLKPLLLDHAGRRSRQQHPRVL